MNSELLKWAFLQGWYQCADWADRDDLKFDVDSPTFITERDERLAKAPSEDEVCLCVDCFGTERGHHEGCAAMLDLHGTAIDKIKHLANRHEAAENFEWKYRKELIDFLRPIILAFNNTSSWKPETISISFTEDSVLIEYQETDRWGETNYTTTPIPKSVFEAADPVAAAKAVRDEKNKLEELKRRQRDVERAKVELQRAQEKLNLLESETKS